MFFTQFTDLLARIPQNYKWCWFYWADLEWFARRKSGVQWTSFCMCHGLPGLPCSQRLRIPLSVTLQGQARTRRGATMQRAKRTYSSGTSGVIRPTEPLAWRPRRFGSPERSMGEARKNGCEIGKSKNWLGYDWYLFPSWMICDYKGRKLFGGCFSSSLRSVVHLGLWVRVFHAMQHLGVGTFGSWNLLLCILRATIWTCNLSVCMVFTNYCWVLVVGRCLSVVGRGSRGLLFVVIGANASRQAAGFPYNCCVLLVWAFHLLPLLTCILHILASAQGGGWGGVITFLTTLRLLVHVTCCRCCRSWANSSKRRTAAEERQSRAKENMIVLKADVDTLQSFVWMLTWSWW